MKRSTRFKIAAFAVLVSGCSDPNAYAPKYYEHAAICVDVRMNIRLPDTQCGEKSTDAYWRYYYFQSPYPAVGATVEGGWHIAPRTESNIPMPVQMGGLPVEGGTVTRSPIIQEK